MMVKKTWRKRLTALINTAMRYSHASPDMLTVIQSRTSVFLDVSSVADFFVGQQYFRLTKAEP